jgi:hypothetical protein
VPLAYLGTISPESPPYVSGGVYFWQWRWQDHVAIKKLFY